jgi:hypothetical protein
MESMEKKDNYTEIFLNVAKRYPEFEEAVEIIKANSEGSSWLIGGFVCRAIIQELYGVPMSKDVDFDFIVENPKKLKLPEGWKIEQNSYGNPKFISSSYEIDYVPLTTVHSITRRGLEPTFANYLSGTPLTIQSIAFDVKSQQVIGDIGIKAIRDKTVGINDLEQAKHRAEKKGKTVEELVKGVADEFGFTSIYP